MAEMKTLNELFVQKQRYVYDAEQRLTEALAKLAEAAQSPARNESWTATLIPYHDIAPPAADDRDRVAAIQSDVSVLITSEYRDVRSDCARSIHLEGSRRTGPFVAFDCGVSDVIRARHHPPTGRDDLADDLRHGYCAAAAGTLFLDRIEMMNGGVQAILMSMLDQTVRHRDRTGRDRSSFPRLITGASGSLRTAVSGGTFNAALFYRLNVIHLDFKDNL